MFRLLLNIVLIPLFIPLPAEAQVGTVPTGVLTLPESKPLSLPVETHIQMMHFPLLESMQLQGVPSWHFKQAGSVAGTSGSQGDSQPK